MDAMTLIFWCVGYVFVLFAIARAADRHLIPKRWINNPFIYVLSLGVLASTWAFFGVIDLAAQYGYGALAYYLGAGAIFLFAPVALAPLAELVRRYKIPSLADLLVFRYHSQRLGTWVTLVMLLAVVPLLTLQLQAVVDTYGLLIADVDFRHSENVSWKHPTIIALGYCAILAVFTQLYGAKQQERSGLVAAMAFESIIKIVALLAVGALAVFGVFGGFGGLDQWLIDNPQAAERLVAPAKETSSHTLLLVFMATAITMPHIFHVSLVDVPVARSMRLVSWAFPLLLMLMAIPVFPILWAGQSLDLRVPNEYLGLALPIVLDHPVLALLVFMGGLSAATGALVTITLALAAMMLNHWVLPLLKWQQQDDIQPRLIMIRRLLIGAVFALSILMYLILGHKYRLTDLALLSFIGTLQLLPGVSAVTHWQTANRGGLKWGLGAGVFIWLLVMVVPALFGWSVLPLGRLGEIPIGIDAWNWATLFSLGVNTLLFIAVSKTTQASAPELYSAALCTEDEMSHPVRLMLDVHSCTDIQDRLRESLGAATAERMLRLALRDLQMDYSERRPYALRRIRGQVQTHLSALMGAAVAAELIQKHLPYHLPSSQLGTDINLMESRLHRYRSGLTGMAAELNKLRLYHRNTLYELPLAVVSIGNDGEILMWNRAMEELTGISGRDMLGSTLNALKEPWQTLLVDFLTNDGEAHHHKMKIEVAGESRWFNLHKSTIYGPDQLEATSANNTHRGVTLETQWATESTSELIRHADGQIILVEEVTELKWLEQKLLHSERLASVGQLAAGVAHEIGNPVTGIACLAQNLKYDTDNPESLETAEMILTQTDRISSIVQSLVSFAHVGSGGATETQSVTLQSCAEEAISLLSLQKEQIPVEFINRIDGHLEVSGDEQKLVQVFINLLSNARDASLENGQVVIVAEALGGKVRCRVLDQGHGITPEDRHKILNPFFTTKEPGNGTGLGLALVYSIIEEHGGNLDIDSPAPAEAREQCNLPASKLPGTCVSVTLQAHQPMHENP